MKGSRLELRDVVFGGVVTVGTTAGPKRVLKFPAAGVTIRDRKMSVPVGPQIQHIDTVGKLGLKLRLGLNDADIDQAGQTGGKLVIPGIHGYGTPR